VKGDLHNMTTQAQLLLNHVKQIENKLSALEAIISLARRSPNGLTLDADKTMEWRKAKVEHGRWFIELQKANKALNKLRKLSHYEICDGKRVAVYNYKR